MQRQQETVVTLSQQEVADCKLRAQQNVAYYADKYGSSGSGQYGHNEVSGNIIGALGENGVSRWLQNNGLYTEDGFEELQGQKCDVFVNGVRLEVKTVRSSQWDSLGRMVPPSSLMKLVRNNAIIVWVVADEGSNTVVIKGWNKAADVRKKGIAVRTRCDNIWLRNQNDVNAPSHLLTHLQSLSN